MTVKRLIEILQKSADKEDIVMRQFIGKKGEIETKEISEATILHYEEPGGFVELY